MFVVDLKLVLVLMQSAWNFLRSRVGRAWTIKILTCEAQSPDQRRPSHQVQKWHQNQQEIMPRSMLLWFNFETIGKIF
jgi:hypothetical protein